MDASLSIDVDVRLPGNAANVNEAEACVMGVVDDLQCDLDQLERTHTALTEDFQALHSLHKDLEYDYKELQDQHSALRAEHKRFKRTFADLEDDYAETFTELTELKEEHAELLRMYHALQESQSLQASNVIMSKYNKRKHIRLSK